jgi:hypothetical protein
MKRRLLPLAVALIALVAAGCYETEVHVKLLPSGAALLIHTVSMPAAALTMRLSSVGASPAQAEKELAQLADQDATLIGDMEVIDIAVQPAGDHVRIVRRYLFANAERLARFLDLLGLTVKPAPGKAVVGLTAAAERLDMEKLTRLGRFYEKPENGDQNGEGKLKSPGGFTLRLTLPETPEQVAPAARKEGRTVSWTVGEDNFGQPFKVAASAKKEDGKLLPLGAAAAFDGAAVDRLLATMPADGAADFTRRMGGRLIPIIHARIDEKLQVDLAFLWASDDVSRDAAERFRRLDEALIPELTVNYYEWLELLRVDGQRIVAEGFRRRAPLAAKDLAGPLTVAKVAGQPQLTFTPPAMYATETPASGPADRVVAMLVVTFPGGQTKHQAVTVADLHSGKPIILAP